MTKPIDYDECANMTNTHWHMSPKSQWRSLESPLLWLAYLPMFLIPWFIQAPTPIQIIGATIGVTIFLVVYFLAIGATGLRLITCSIVTLFIAIALIPTYGNWTVIAIYAAAMIGDLRPPRRAAILVGAFAFIAVFAGMLSQQNPFYWGFGIFMMVMVGIGVISRAALQDKNHALTNAQMEVKQLAAIAERERIGRDLHDMLGSTLTLIAIKADLAARLATSDPQGAEAEMRAVAATARDGLADVRAAVAGMTGATLAREIATSQTALSAAGIASVVEGDAEAIERGASAVLAMALREAITNVIRHSGANSCRIAVTNGDDRLSLTVSDDGNGEALRESGGIGGMRARLAAAGGGLSVTGGRAGAKIVAYLPIEAS
ncbi:MAG: sensor histidine kinase [Hyphomonadaceae bacterium]